jgi:cytochrome c-type biogenesis protein CcmH/NrfG
MDCLYFSTLRCRNSTTTLSNREVARNESLATVDCVAEDHCRSRAVMNSWLWFVAGLSAGAAVTLGTTPLRRAIKRPGSRESFAWTLALGGLGVFAVAAAGLYLGINAHRGGGHFEPAAAATHDPAPDSRQGAQSDPGSAQQLLALAAERRGNHDYAGAREAYSKVIQLDGMTADAWADYADAIASMSAGSLGGEAELAIQHALELDPSHPKALWLEATRAYKERRYADAVALWTRLRGALRPESPDVAIVDANIAESTQLAARPPG